MTTVLEKIWLTIDALLTPLALEYEREPAGDPNEFPALAGYSQGWARLDGDGMMTRRRLSITIEGYVDGDGGFAPTAERAELAAATVAALMADETLGDLIEQIEDTDLRFTTAVLSEKRRLGFAQDFEIQFTTSRRDPALPA